jgi:hypothetical protein
LKVGQTLTTEHSPTAVTFVSTFGQGEKEDVVFGVFVLFFPVLLPVFDDMLAKTLAFGLTLATLPPQGMWRFVRVLVLTMLSHGTLVFLVWERGKAFVADRAGPITLIHGEFSHRFNHRLGPIRLHEFEVKSGVPRLKMVGFRSGHQARVAGFEFQLAHRARPRNFLRHLRALGLVFLVFAVSIVLT